MNALSYRSTARGRGQLLSWAWGGRTLGCDAMPPPPPLPQMWPEAPLGGRGGGDLLVGAGGWGRPWQAGEACSPGGTREISRNHGAEMFNAAIAPYNDVVTGRNTQ